MKQLLSKINKWWNGPSLIVYCACKMSGRDRLEMVQRAEYVVSVFKKYGIEAISPVLKESVPAVSGKLVNTNEDRLREFWKDDKYIIRRIAHAVLFDHAEMFSFGMTREYSLNRGTLWKPTVSVLEKGVPVSVAKYEDDSLHYSVHSAAALMAEKWSSRKKRIVWRAKMISRSLPRWIADQIWQWR